MDSHKALDASILSEFRVHAFSLSVLVLMMFMFLTSEENYSCDRSKRLSKIKHF